MLYSGEPNSFHKLVQKASATWEDFLTGYIYKYSNKVYRKKAPKISLNLSQRLLYSKQSFSQRLVSNNNSLQS